MPVYTDQVGRKIELTAPPRRIVSLVPSQTELLADLGLNEQVAGITKFCIHPEIWYRTKPRIGGTKQVKMDLVAQLSPDLVIANKEENVKEQVEELANHYPVWISDVNNLDDAYQMIGQLGSITGTETAAQKMVTRIKGNFSGLTAENLHLKTTYLIWRDPYMTVGGDTFINSMLELAGFRNLFEKQYRYPEVTIDELKEAGCELLLLSSEPFPFNEKHKRELQQLLPGTRIILVDGEMFSWYGSRLLYAASYFMKLRMVVNGQW
jgi:ABC-type Fe3+-hydroxamate transport system substrate-binding protein